ncbi:hypothetical protein BEL04_08615 [Mucilaginibacter sp. PPCGB 2223]|uniref:hypothetical protein n=1 Tax=Mucilaginibacter sp. PPCGB 2223 TaxID=1886027 RepID=UPI000824F9FD|nr:hypothetical protein [Mucilaginibacter sp. PPCGB 2223]OCX54311.1 hypothetical protein BEL04_08615 [Mucilaginibacter sp. PPCGB 2223]
MKRIDQKGTYLRLFLYPDNPGFFPPKDLLKGGVVKDGEEYVFVPWYLVVDDPNEVIKAYGIGKVMRWADIK